MSSPDDRFGGLYVMLGVQDATLDASGRPVPVPGGRGLVTNHNPHFYADDDTLVTDPQTEISLIYYNNRGGLEDRVFRIKTDRSSATSLPEPRTGHNISNVEIVSQSGDVVEVRFNWLTLYYRYQNIDPYFGTSFYTIDFTGPEPQITKKKVVLKNDYIHHVVDIYHV